MMNFLLIIFTLWAAISQIIDTTAQMINGLEVKNSGFEYQVLIIVEDEICGGAVIDEWHVLTAAHCFDTDSLRVYVVAGVITAKDNKKVIRSVKEIHIHPNFTSGIIDSTGHRPQRLGNDIAVLKLHNAIELGGSVKKIDLPTTNVPYCHICFLSGWGPFEVDGDQPPAVLQWTTLTIGTPELCESRGASHGADDFCGEDPLETSSPSPGDSGSPMRCDDELTGIVSIGFGNSRTPAIFTNVYKHLDFINEIISH